MYSLKPVLRLAITVTAVMLMIIGDIPTANVLVSAAAAKPKAPPKEKDKGQIALELHNKYRKLHKANPVTLDPKLTAEAQKMADAAARSLDEYTGSTRNNLWYLVCRPDYLHGEIMADAINMWYETKRLADPTMLSTLTRSWEFTLIVWKDTKKIGAAVAFNPRTRTHATIVLYSPPGNEYYKRGDATLYWYGNVTL